MIWCGWGVSMGSWELEKQWKQTCPPSPLSSYCAGAGWPRWWPPGRWQCSTRSHLYRTPGWRWLGPSHHLVMKEKQHSTTRKTQRKRSIKAHIMYHSSCRKLQRIHHYERIWAGILLFLLRQLDAYMSESRERLRVHLGPHLALMEAWKRGGCAQDPESESFSHHLFKSLGGPQVPQAYPSRRETTH